MNQTTSVNQTAASDARSWAIACHLSPLLTFLGLPFGHIVGPLMIWLLKKHESPFLDRQGREALNFHLSITLYLLGLGLLALFPGLFLIALGRPVALLGLATCILAGSAALGLILFDFVMIIVSAIRTSDGHEFRYPLTVRFL